MADIWVLGDDRTGNTSQAIAVAEKLGASFLVHNVKYNLFGSLPNFLLSIKPFHVKNNFFSNLIDQPAPKLIISSGRRTASLAIYLKKQSKGDIKIVQIMRPGIPINDFDLIVLPQHDKFDVVSAKIVKTIGALCNIKPKLEPSAAQLAKHYPEIKKFIGILIGGDNKAYKYSDYAIKELIESLHNIRKRYSLPLFISFTRRTSDKMRNNISQNFGGWPNVIYDPENLGYNPYFGLLAKAEFLIVTCDSISMASEAASTGKPLYLFCHKDFKLKKHKYFMQQLFDLGIARPFNKSTLFLEQYSYRPLNEAEKVAEIIKTEILATI